MACKCKIYIHPVALALIFLGLISWVVALGGVAASTHYCYTNSGQSNVTIISGNSNQTIINTPGGCINTFSLPWWGIWFELFILFGMLVTCFMDAFEKGRYIFLSFLSMVTFFLTISARDFINSSIVSGGLNLADLNLDAFNAGAAGCIMLGVVNYALIAFIGLGATGEIPEVAMPAAVAKFGFESRAQRYQPSSTQGF